MRTVKLNLGEHMEVTEYIRTHRLFAANDLPQMDFEYKGNLNDLLFYERESPSGQTSQVLVVRPLEGLIMEKLYLVNFGEYNPFERYYDEKNEDRTAKP